MSGLGAAALLDFELQINYFISVDVSWLLWLMPERAFHKSVGGQKGRAF